MTMTKLNRIPSVQEIRDHAEGLSKAFGVRLCLDLKDPAHAQAIVDPLTTMKWVRAAPIDCLMTYAAVLHEIGHHCNPFGRIRREIFRGKSELDLRHPRFKFQYKNALFEEETAAWDWAQHYALVWTDEMEHMKQMCMDTYRTVRII
jgi:hypothetical protein